MSFTATTCNNMSDVSITLMGVNSTGGVLPSANATMGLLVGDINGNRVVDLADRDALEAAKRQPVTAANFRADIHPDGNIDRTDYNVLKAAKHNALQ